MKKGSINVGIIGVGNWGKNLVRNFSELSDCNLVMCCDKNATKLDNLGVGKIFLTTCPKDMFCSRDVDAVVIATPTSTHFALASEAIHAGKSVFMEKPMCSTADEASKLCNMKKRPGSIVMIGHLLLYHPGIAKLKEVIDSGKLGKLLYAYSQRLNLGKIRSDENALSSLGVHDLSVLLYLFDSMPHEVNTVGECYLQTGTEDVVFLSLKFSDNQMGHLHVSWLDPHKTRKIVLVGEKGMVVFDDMQLSEKVKIYGKHADPHNHPIVREGDVYSPIISRREPLSIECRHFIDCVKSGTQPLSDANNGLAVMKVLQAAQDSLKSKKSVFLE